jgi:citrate lyase beta subunit
VEAFETADSGLVVLDDKLLEKPVLRSMYRVLARAGV